MKDRSNHVEGKFTKAEVKDRPSCSPAADLRVRVIGLLNSDITWEFDETNRMGMGSL